MTIVCVGVVLSPWEGTYYKGQGPLCKGEYHIPSLLRPAADVSTSKLWNPFLSLSPSVSLSRAITHTQTHSFPP